MITTIKRWQLRYRRANTKVFCFLSTQNPINWALFCKHWGETSKDTNFHPPPFPWENCTWCTWSSGDREVSVGLFVTERGPNIPAPIRVLDENTLVLPKESIHIQKKLMYTLLGFCPPYKVTNTWGTRKNTCGVRELPLSPLQIAPWSFPFTE